MKLAEGRKQTASHSERSSRLKRKSSKRPAASEQKRKSLAMAREKLNSDKDRFGPFFPIPGEWNKEEEARELSSPWADPELSKRTGQAFLEALQLHKTFIAANANTMRKLTRGHGRPFWSGARYRTDGGSRGCLDDALFHNSRDFHDFCFDRLFSHLGREFIGWLLIHEAGQAVPQSAAGAIWRAKRSVVVGDPLQLEPVVTIPFTVQQALRKGPPG